MPILTLIALLVALTLALAVALALAYVPMHLLVTRIAANVTMFIQRQRERRQVARGTPERRKQA